jgi:DNA-binding transcriptional regulator GbsR (MarR family)
LNIAILVYGPNVEARAEQRPADDFVERFAAVMVASGMPRMASRVFAALLSRDDGSATSAELASALQASPAAISGAVRYLIQVHVVTKTQLPGERRDVYRLLSDDWYEMVGHREHELQQWAKLSREGVDVMGANTRAGRRLEETARFFEFLVDEIPGVLERWRQEARNG